MRPRRSLSAGHDSNFATASEPKKVAEPSKCTDMKDYDHATLAIIS